MTSAERDQMEQHLRSVGWTDVDDVLTAPSGGLFLSESHFSRWTPAEMYDVFRCRVEAAARQHHVNSGEVALENAQVRDAALSAFTPDDSVLSSPRSVGHVRIAKQRAGRGFFAEVKVRVASRDSAPGESMCVAVRSVPADFAEAALLGVRWGRKVASSKQHFLVEEIHATLVDSNALLFALAWARATWRATNFDANIEVHARMEDLLWRSYDYSTLAVIDAELNDVA